MTTPLSVPRVAAWSGELLWPCALPEGEVVDLSAVRALGAWTHDWFRRHPGTAIVGGAAYRDRLLRAGLPVRWCATLAEATAANGGVSAGEREMLWS